MKDSTLNIILLIILILVLAIVGILHFYVSTENFSTEKGQKLNNLEFNIVIKENGNVQVTENWDISIKGTQTLYKNFEIDEEKYSKITDISVKEIIDGNVTSYSNVNKYMYYLEENTYYALDLKNGLFEIAWGTELSEKKIRRKYQITYTLVDAIANYNDCSEFYWQFLGENFNISANKIKGTITLPNGIQNKNDIRIWGHIESLNGNIKVKDKNTIFFNVSKYQKNQYLEVRVVLPPNIVKSKNVDNGKTLELILQEEKLYADSSNKQRIVNGLIQIVGLVIILVIVYFEIKAIKKYIRMLQENKRKKLKPEIDFKYFREIPNENTSPGQVAFLLNSENEPTHGDFTNVFTATILNLAYKEYFEIKTKESVIGEPKTYIEFTEKGETYKRRLKYGIEKNDDLQKDEVPILKYLINLAKDNSYLEMSEITNYIQRCPDNEAEFLELVQNVQNKIEVVQNLNGNINSNSKKMVKKYRQEQGLNIAIASAIFMIINYTQGFVSFGWLFLIMLGSIVPIAINMVILDRVKESITYLSQKGVDERDKWEALKKYIEDYSLLNEKNELSLVVWEKFLIYATVFGISKEVLNSIKIQKQEELPNRLRSYNTFYRSQDLMNFQISLRGTMVQIVQTQTITRKSSAGGFGGGFSAGGGHGGGRSRRRRTIVKKG